MKKALLAVFLFCGNLPAQDVAPVAVPSAEIFPTATATPVATPATTPEPDAFSVPSVSSTPTPEPTPALPDLPPIPPTPQPTPVETPIPEKQIRVASLSTILTEIAQRVGGTHVAVTGLVQPGIDPHEYEPKPADISRIAEAELVLASGKHLEGYLAKLHHSSGSAGTFLEVGDRIPSLKMNAEAGTSGQIEDPHWWNSVANVQLATGIVRDALVQIDPGHIQEYRKNAAAYLDELDQLQRWARVKVAELPRDQRRLVTSHDAFQYFARDFGFTIDSIEGVSPEDEPSNRKVIELIDTIRRAHVKAVFGEFGNNPKVLNAITRESGAKAGGELFADGLGRDDASTYVGMMKHNLTTIVDGLK